MEKLLTMEDVIEIGVGKRTSIWKKVKTGEFPKPIRLGNSHSSPQIPYWSLKINLSLIMP